MLELGGGHGIAATFVLERLTSGRFVGVDRSATMIDASTRRNAAAVEAGRARFAQGTIGDLDNVLGDQRFDRIFAARVAALSGVTELRTVARHLRPGGAVVLSFESPQPERTARLVADTTVAAGDAGLHLTSTAESTIDGSVVGLLTFGSTHRPGPAH